ncbi:MAG TPA: hypothetical protein VM802_26210 [Chitinophaga sp.]|uniref:hypothetical protein n=1 Tax=Chitinophaga sp. TaxID=1869181 RepID=UPI002CBF25DF|nr:hypothetical protein [Chitinophaga sp.]HVI48391.1 hypothetical protein [Chitinophaga sp.]
MTWERKALHFINQTSRWDRDKHISSFLSFSIKLAKNLLDADIAFQTDIESETTARVRNATPAYLNDYILEPGPLRELAFRHAYKNIYWPEIPPPQLHPFEGQLEGHSSAVVIPLNVEPGNSLIVLGWSNPQTFEAPQREFVETIRLRLKEILLQTQQQLYFQGVAMRFAAMLHTMPHAVIFTNNDGHSGWVNQRAADMLHLTGPGEQLPSILSDALTSFRSRALNEQDIYTESIRLFTTADDSIANWEWQMPEKVIRVSSLPVITQQINGRLWIFES